MLDSYESEASNCLSLYGKVRNDCTAGGDSLLCDTEAPGEYVSCCVRVRELWPCAFVVPVETPGACERLLVHVEASLRAAGHEEGDVCVRQVLRRMLPQRSNGSGGGSRAGAAAERAVATPAGAASPLRSMLQVSFRVRASGASGDFGLRELLAPCAADVCDVLCTEWSPTERMLLDLGTCGATWLQIDNAVRCGDEQARSAVTFCRTLFDARAADIRVCAAKQPLASPPPLTIASVHVHFDEWRGGSNSGGDARMPYSLRSFSCVLHRSNALMLSARQLRAESPSRVSFHHYEVRAGDEIAAEGGSAADGDAAALRAFVSGAYGAEHECDIQFFDASLGSGTDDTAAAAADDDATDADDADGDRARRRRLRRSLEARRACYGAVLAMFERHDPDIVVNHGMLRSNLMRMVYEMQMLGSSGGGGKARPLCRSFFGRRRSANLRVRADEVEAKWPRHDLALEGRLVFDTQVLYDVYMKDDIAKQVRSDSVYELIEAYGVQASRECFRPNRCAFAAGEQGPGWHERFAANVVGAHAQTAADEASAAAAAAAAAATAVEQSASRDCHRHAAVHGTRLGRGRNCINTAYRQLELVCELQLFAFTLRVTQLCGNLWADNVSERTAARIEYLIMHEMHKKQYVVERRGANCVGVAGGADGAGGADASYTGGTVRQVVKGCYAGYSFLVDVESMYPTIIEHERVCIAAPFAPVRAHEREGRPAEPVAQAATNTAVSASTTTPTPIPPPPPPPTTTTTKTTTTPPPLLLPSIVRDLREKRRAAKEGVRKGANDMSRTLATIEARALKLLSNQCYGCLGYKRFRFYNAELASRITQHGRQILATLAACVDEHNAAAASAAAGGGGGSGNTDGRAGTPLERFEIIYGHTDSLLVHAPNAVHYGACTAQFGKLYERMCATLRDRGVRVKHEAVFRKVVLYGANKYVAVRIRTPGAYVGQMFQLAPAATRAVPAGGGDAGPLGASLEALNGVYEIDVVGCEVVNRERSYFAQRTCMYLLHQMLFCDAHTLKLPPRTPQSGGVGAAATERAVRDKALRDDFSGLLAALRKSTDAATNDTHDAATAQSAQHPDNSAPRALRMVCNTNVLNAALCTYKKPYANAHLRAIDHYAKAADASACRDVQRYIHRHARVEYAYTAGGGGGSGSDALFGSAGGTASVPMLCDEIVRLWPRVRVHWRYYMGTHLADLLRKTLGVFGDQLPMSLESMLDAIGAAPIGGGGGGGGTGFASGGRGVSPAMAPSVPRQTAERRDMSKMLAFSLHAQLAAAYAPELDVLRTRRGRLVAPNARPSVWRRVHTAELPFADDAVYSALALARARSAIAASAHAPSISSRCERADGGVQCLLWLLRADDGRSGVAAAAAAAATQASGLCSECAQKCATRDDVQRILERAVAHGCGDCPRLRAALPDACLYKCGGGAVALVEEQTRARRALYAREPPPPRFAGNNSTKPVALNGGTGELHAAPAVSEKLLRAVAKARNALYSGDKSAQ